MADLKVQQNTPATNRIPSDQPPMLWPRLETRDLVVAPVFNATFWFALIKENVPGTLTKSQTASLRSLGFQSGSAERLIYPKCADHDLAVNIGRILNAPLDLITSEQTVMLKPASSTEPAVPLEVQACIRSLWKYQPELLLTEIQTSLAQREDELSEQTLNETQNNRMHNRLRIQRWVAGALAGELSAVTEPIIGLGLVKAGQAYGPLQNWPPNLREWADKLADERGEDRPESIPLPANLLLADSLTPDYRPDVGSEISWTVNGQRGKGVITDHDPDTTNVLWVSSSTLTETINGVYFPSRKRITTDCIDGLNIPAPVNHAPVVEAPTTPVRYEPLVPVNPDLLKPQERLTPEEIGSPFDQTLKNDPDFWDEELRLLESMFRLGRLQGESPLTPSAEAQSHTMIEYWYGGTRDLIMKDGMGDSEIQATVFLRDMIMDDFNRAQPPTPNGERGFFAVYPSRALGTNDYTNDLTGSEIEQVRAQEICRVGVHPIHTVRVREALRDWAVRLSDTADELSPELIDSLKEDVDAITKAKLWTRGLIKPAIEPTYAATQFVAHRAGKDRVRNTHTSESLNILAENAEDFCAAVLDTTFPNYKSAGDWINGLSPNIARVTETNERILQALSDITDSSLADIEKTDHPVFVIIDALHEAGMPQCSKAQALGIMNCDLSNHLDWVGQLSYLNGTSIRLSQSTKLSHEHPSETDINQLLSYNFREVTQAMTSTGWIESRSQKRPFQITIAATSENLNFETQKAYHDKLFTGTNILSVSNLFSQEDTRPFRHDYTKVLAGLGRMVSLHADHGLEFGKPIHDEIVHPDSLDDLPLNIFTMNLIADMDNFGSSLTGTLKNTGIAKLESIPVEAMGDLQPDALLQHCQGARESLLTLVPSWRDDSAKRDQMMEAIELWIDEQKHLKAFANKSKFCQKVSDTLVSSVDNEIIILATKNSRKKIYSDVTAITRDGILAADNNRALAVEKALLEMKSSRSSFISGWEFSAFDAATVMRPQALRVLNEHREALRLKFNQGNAENNLSDATAASKGKRGKRQDKGVVAGLSIKDLRGKSTAILSNLLFASSEDQAKHITKVKLWETPDWTSLESPDDEAIDDGARAMEPIVAAFFAEARKDIIPMPPANVPEVNQAFAKLVLSFRDAMEEIRTQDELKDAILPSGALMQALTIASEEFKKIGFTGDFISGPRWALSSVPEYWLSQANAKSLRNTIWPIKDAKTGANRRKAITDDTGAMPMLSALVRTGGDNHRADTSIDEQTLITTFGFSGIEYGNSMTQADRTEYLNQTYDGFMDLSKVLGVPPLAMSLGGSLGLAFGSRGRGGRNAALAHFEPTNNVINLTRMKGAGSAAHEYGHALANYFYRLSRGMPGSRSEGDITETLDRQLNATKSDPKFISGNLRNPVAEAIGSILQNIRYELPKKEDGQPYTLQEAAEHRYEQSPLIEGARLADNNRSGHRRNSKAYWNTPEELFARSFETWVHTGLQKLYPGFQNDFLVRKDKLESWGTPISMQDKDKPAKAQLYPSGDQLESLHQAFKGLFKTVKQKDIEVNHEHLGKTTLPILYSHDTGSIEAVTPREHQIIAECVMNEVARMCGDQVWVQWSQHLQDNNGKKVAGQYRDLDAAGSRIERNVRGVIDLAYGARMGTAYHEAFHFAQSALLNEGDQQMLDRAYTPGSPLFDDLCETLEGTNRAHLIPHCENNPREAQAYAYESWVAGSLKIESHQKPATTFGRIKKFFGDILKAGQQASFKTPDQLFKAFYSGQMAKQNIEQNHTQSVGQAPGKPMIDTVNNSPLEADTNSVNEHIYEANSDDEELPVCR